MAAVATAYGKSLVMRVQTGVSANGNPIFKNISFKSKLTATDQQIWDTAASLNSLQAASLSSVIREDYFDITDAG